MLFPTWKHVEFSSTSDVAVLYIIDYVLLSLTRKTVSSVLLNLRKCIKMSVDLNSDKIISLDRRINQLLKLMFDKITIISIIEKRSNRSCRFKYINMLIISLVVVGCDIFVYMYTLTHHIVVLKSKLMNLNYLLFASGVLICSYNTANNTYHISQKNHIHNII